MFGVVLGLILAAVSPNSTKIKAICEVGGAALNDLPNVNANKNFDAYYAAFDPKGEDLLTICPELKSAIPKGYPIADAEAQSRAAVHVPIPGRSIREAFIYSIGVPKLSSDLNSAIVHFSYSCTGLCGGELEARYVRTAEGWQRDGAIHMLWVS